MSKSPFRRSVAAILALAAATGSASFADNNGRRGPVEERHVARLVPVQEVPSVSSAARGWVTLVVDEAEQTISYEGLEGPVVQAHIHTGQFGANGGIMVWFCGTAAQPGPAGTPVCPASPGTVSGVLTATQVVGPVGQGIAPGEFAEVVAAIRNGVAYANVHSGKFAGGEIRGQLRRGWGGGHD